MSEFINAVKTGLTGKRVAEIGPLELLSVDFSKCSSTSYDTMDEFRIEVVYGTIIRCRDQAELREAKEIFIRSLREAIFGEFRQKAIALERELYSGSRESIAMKLHLLMREVLG